jgi:hypothetical protein
MLMYPNLLDFDQVFLIQMSTHLDVIVYQSFPIVECFGCSVFLLNSQG